MKRNSPVLLLSGKLGLYKYFFSTVYNQHIYAGSIPSKLVQLHHYMTLWNYKMISLPPHLPTYFQACKCIRSIFVKSPISVTPTVALLLIPAIPLLH